MIQERLDILKNLTLLYVEDDADIRAEIQKLISRFFKELYTAKNGMEGINLFKQHMPDLVLTDLRMPEMNGMEMSKQIKVLNPETPIIVTTAHNESGYLLEAIELGLDRYLLKPVDLNLLIEALEKTGRLVYFKKQKSEKEREMQFLLDMNPDFILLIKNNRIEYINKTFLKFLKIDSLEKFITNLSNFNSNLIYSEDYSCIHTDQDWIKNAITSPEKENTICMKDPQNTDLIKIFRVIANQLPEKEKFVVTLYDITLDRQEKEILKNQTMIDPLTGLFNRRYYNDKIAKEIDRARRYKSPLSLIIMDIDHFKSVNDEFGHAAGDSVLKYIGDILRQYIRKHDAAIRIGGEEILIIASETNTEQAALLCEKLRIIIENHNFDLGKKITCSFGVSEFKENDDAATLFERTDKNLYTAKKSGRNQVARD